MKFAEYLRCEGCGKMIPREACVIEDRKFCSKECYEFIQWYKQRRAYYKEEKGGSLNN